MRQIRKAGKPGRPSVFFKAVSQYAPVPAAGARRKVARSFAE
ncbi:hypothetical protein BSIN_4324 [Burkholderia singularis]|uniref:Uncharacterized protein n=1 Tax=Burkholderia singularis TaxID=1503053 RepID=A0A238H7Z1_9BURK|nr:hypothetical protein BSIN_4324 [Burkholderia singularis]